MSKQLWSATPALVATAAAAALLLSACSAGSSGGSTGASQGGKAAVTKAPASVTVAFPSKMNNLDPDLGYNVQEINAIGLWGEGLYEFRYGTASKPEPGLAQRATTSANGLTWTFTLRPNLKFSDGTPLTSADVVATLNRDRTNADNVWAFFAAPMKSVSAPNASTVVVRLSEVYPSLPTILAESGFAILPASAYKKPASYMQAPVSAGPYKVASWGGGNNATFVENPYYWGPKPVIKTVKFTTVADFNTTLAQLKTGETGMAEGLPMSIQPQLSGGGLQWKLQQMYGFYGFPFNDTAAPFNNVNVRKAVSLALDRAQMNTIVWRGLAKPLSSFWPNTMTGYDSSIATARNVAAAKKLLAGTPCAHGCSIQLDISPILGGWASQLAQVAANNLADIGIHVKITSLTATGYNNDVILHPKYQMSIAFLYDYANIPDGMLEYAALPGSFFHSFYSYWKDPKLTAAIQQARQTTGAGQAAALAEINTLFDKDVPYATIATDNDLWVQRVSSKFIDVEPTDQVEVARSGG
jgi:peptide/nickel transport system substrate-binding protein